MWRRPMYQRSRGAVGGRPSIRPKNSPAPGERSESSASRNGHLDVLGGDSVGCACRVDRLQPIDHPVTARGLCQPRPLRIQFGKGLLRPSPSSWPRIAGPLTSPGTRGKPRYRSARADCPACRSCPTALSPASTRAVQALRHDHRGRLADLDVTRRHLLRVGRTQRQRQVDHAEIDRGTGASRRREHRGGRPRCGCRHPRR